MTRLNIDNALALLDLKGPFAQNLKGYEPRSEQKAMMRNVLEAYHLDQIALIEAGTGTGKSLAYLIPAMLWAAETKQRTVISTNTINLQEQLIQKDIPFVDQTLGLNLKAVLVKGMGNYLCLRKLHDLESDHWLLQKEELEQLQKIDAWKETTRDGSRSSLPCAPSAALWDKISADSDTCSRSQCPFFQQCHFFKARKQAQEAQILVANHHLLFADLARRAESGKYDDPAILPPYTRIIIDEAHNIEDIATDYFAARVGHRDLMRLAARLGTERRGLEQGNIHKLKDILSRYYKGRQSSEAASLLTRFEHDIPGGRQEMLRLIRETFDAFEAFADAVHKRTKEEAGDQKLRLLPEHRNDKRWQEAVVPVALALCDTLERLSQALAAAMADFHLLDNEKIQEAAGGAAFETLSIANRLAQAGEVIRRIISPSKSDNNVRWIEWNPQKIGTNTTLTDACLDISEILVQYLFSKFPTIVLCSATMTSNNGFSFLRSRLGLLPEHLNGRTITENLYHSPFNYSEQALFAIPNDLPNPSSPHFIAEASEKIWQALLASKGNAFILFTSFAMLGACFDILKPRMLAHRMHPLKQGEEDRQQLLIRFKETKHSVLFGADSFWEGVDVVGDALQCVILVKLPFRVPTEPIIQARSEAISAKGGDPFLEYSLPQAIVKFKQGFGRLIRNRRDRGCIVCLDNRILTKPYGQYFLKSLPDCQRIIGSSESMNLRVKEFYLRHPQTKTI